MNNIQEAILKSQLNDLVKQKKYTHSVRLCSQLLTLNPKDTHTWFIFGQIQQALNKPEQAVKALINAGQSKSDIAIQALKLAVEICLKHEILTLGFLAAQALTKFNPDNAKALYHHGLFSASLDLDYLACINFDKAIKLESDNKNYRVAYAKSLTHTGEITKSLAEYDAAIKLDSSNANAIYCSAFTHNYSDKVLEDKVFQVHKELGECIESKFPIVEAFKKRAKSKRIKIAYLSKDLLVHSVTFFFLALIKHYNVNKFEIFCYADLPPEKADDMSEKIKSYNVHWMHCDDMSDQQLYKQIRNDEIDILVDLQGLTGVPRSSVFAMKAAPIQVNYLGYPNTSGFSRMDYRIVDNWTDPEGLTEQYNTETLLRLPSGFLCYSPELPSTLITPPPALSLNKITFGSFNVFPKITESMLLNWVEILNRVPNSQLLVKAKFFKEQQNQKKIEHFFEAKGINKDRLILKATIFDKKEHIELYNQVDIHLDTAPYNGTTTTCEALWQGVPTVTLAGSNHRSRVGCSILQQVGLEDYIATSSQEYIDIAVSKASNLKQLEELRSGMRNKLQSSLLFDEKLFINELEAEYLKAYNLL